MMDHLRSLFGKADVLSPHEIVDSNEFSYTDPTDKSVATGQGIRFIFKDGSRIIFRLSGTGSVGATIRMYIDKYETEQLAAKPADILKQLIDIALEISKLQDFTGRNK